MPFSCAFVKVSCNAYHYSWKQDKPHCKWEATCLELAYKIRSINKINAINELKIIKEQA